MKFTKMHNAGNDYVYVNGFEEKIEDLINNLNLKSTMCMQ